MITKTMDKTKLLQNAEMIYKKIAEKDKMLCKDFLSISLEAIGQPFNLSFPRRRESREKQKNSKDLDAFCRAVVKKFKL